LEFLALVLGDRVTHLFLELTDKLLVVVEHLSQFTPPLFKFIVLLCYRDLRLISVIDNSHGSFQLSIKLFLTCLQNGNSSLQLDFLIFGLVNGHARVELLGARHLILP
jgi:hypothetical protein